MSTDRDRARHARRIARRLLAGLERDGGATVWRTVIHSRGYLVGGVRPALVGPRFGSMGEDPAAPSVDAIASFVLAAFPSPDVDAFGIWRDDVDGRVYVDACQHVDALDVALDIARTRGEIAVWYIAGAYEVRTGASPIAP